MCYKYSSKYSHFFCYRSQLGLFAMHRQLFNQDNNNTYIIMANFNKREQLKEISRTVKL